MNTIWLFLIGAVKALVVFLWITSVPATPCIDAGLPPAYCAELLNDGR